MTALIPATQHIKQLFIIDKNVDGWRDLVNNAGIGVSVLILDPLQNGLTQIANAITAYTNLDAIHILSHGSVASLQLGSATLNSENLNQYTEQLTTIGNALNENGDLLLYGCNVAQGDAGQQFIEQLSVLTGADVAASTNLTGDANQGGDWALESQTGSIETTSIITKEAQATYHNTLATTVGVFAATDATNGTELWVTDGTAAGTSLLKDIYVGILSSSPHAITSLGNGKAVFVATGITSPSNYSYDVWITDGTTSAILVKDIRSPYSDSQFFFTSLGNGKALFSGFDSNLNRNLWVTDGTAAGTNTIAIAIAIGLFIYYPESIAVLGNGKALFSTHSTNGAGLWITDGTTAGTSLVKSFFDGTPISYPPQYLTSLSNGKALFSAGNSVNGAELWITDGTTAGTVLVKDINTGTSSSHPQSFTDLNNGKAVFNAYNTTTGHELWVTDGTAMGTNLVKNGMGSFDSTSFTVLGNGKVLFSSTLGLWVTDATTAGTNLVKNIFIGTGDPYSQIITSLGNGKALFSAYDSTNGYELWVSDGTTAGTHLVKDINTGINSSKPQSFTALGNGKATFSATDANNDTELWITDGTAAGTSRFKDVNNDGDSSDPQSFATLANGKVLFSAYDANNGTELWITDGTVAGTSLIKDIYAGITSSNPQSLTSLGNGKVLFKAGVNDYIGGNEDLWVSDGTAAGTNLLQAATGNSYPSSMISLSNGKAVFSFYDATNGSELWATDGTVAGTALVKDIFAGISSSDPQSFVSLGNGKVLFDAHTQLWITDGTAAGTALVKDIFADANGAGGIYYAVSITSLGNGKALFSTYNSELWITDGTMAGTSQVQAGTNVFHSTYIASLGNGKAVFTSYDTINGNELWITDGTTAGTVLLKDINLGIADSSPQFITSLGNGKVLFSAYDTNNGSKLWVTDGTTAGTTIFTGTGGYSYIQLGNGKFVFVGNDATNGSELWITDGTAAGTNLVKDIFSGIGSSNPQSFTLLSNGKAVFSAFDAVNGRELWITDGTAAGTSLVKDINTLATQSSYPSAVTLITGANTNTNTAPTVLAGTTTAFTEQTPITVAGTITINDPNGDADWNGGTLQVQITANNTINDGLALPTANNGGVWLNAGNVLMANTTVIGTANAAIVSNGGAWTFTFNAAATNALVQDTARAIQFTNNSEAPSTAARTVTFTVIDKNAASNSAIQTVSVTAVNDAPTITAFLTPVGTGNEDSEISITFASLQSQGNAADADGTVTAFVIKTVNSGTLRIGTDAITATAWNASNNSVDASHQAYWTPALNTNGTLNAFTVVAKDNGGLESITPVQATVSITAVNDAPTLTSFTSVVASGNEDSEIPVTFASLQAQGNAADIDGTVTAFVIKAVNSGTLRIGTDAITATAWSVSNNSVDASHQAYWTPALNTNGTLNAFTAVAKDNSGLESITPVPATVTIAAVNDAPTLTNFTSVVATGNEDSEIPITFANLQTQGNEADVDGSVIAFLVKGVSSGTLKIGTSVATASDWNALLNYIVDATHQAYWTPAPNANGTLNAFTVTARDNGGLESVTPVQATVSGVAVLDATMSLGITPVEGGTVGTFIVTLDSAAPIGGLTVNYTLAGTATLTTDYTVTAGSNITTMTGSSFTIAAGQTTAVLNVNALSDIVTDSNETIVLNLTTGAGYQLPTLFSPKVDYMTGFMPYSVSVGDVNNDGKLDLVVANKYSNTVSVLLRNFTNTSFDTKVDYVTGTAPNSVSVGDFNSDGKLDLAVANSSSNTVSVLLRNAANTGFNTKVDYATGIQPASVSVGDFNNDGKLDLAVANSSSNTVSVLLRNAANTGFDTKVDYATGSYPDSISVGDFNNDGKLDLATANNNSNTISILLRNATNTGFDAKVDYATGINPFSVSTGDFNNDGKLDLAIANYSSNTVSVLMRNAANTGFDAKVDYATGSSLWAVSVADFNNDGKLDLVAVVPNGNTVSVFLRNTANTGFDTKIDYATGVTSMSVVNVGDFNNDGKTDLVVANGSSNINTVSVLLNNSNHILTITDTPPNIAPTLTTFSSVVATGSEDSQITVSFADLQAQGNEADVDGTVTAFVIKAVNTGTLKIGTDAVTATAWSVSNNSIDASHQAYWTPALNTNGTLNAFTAVAKDNGGLESITPVQATVNIAAVNDAPTLTAFLAPIGTGNEDSEIPITFANLQTQCNEADIDGTVTAFIIKAVNSGTLRIGSDALTATAWSASNNSIDASHQAYWTPALNANGTLNAFTTVAKDNGSLESITPVQATVSINAVNDAPIGIPDNNASNAVIEAGTGVVGDSSAVGNVLNNDTDADSVLWVGDTKAVASVNNQIGNVGSAVTGLYGSLILSANGSYTYTLDNVKAATNALTAGQVVTDTFTYTVVDAHGAISASTTLTISVTGSNDALPTASQLFNLALMPEEKSVAGGEQAGMIRTMADFAKAAYHLEPSENNVINDLSPNADAAAIGLTAQGWTALNLHPTLSATSVVAGQTITNGMFNDGFYINGNAAACVERCGDAIVLSFRGTNDYAGKGSFSPNQNDPNDVARPDYDQWTDMPSYYALLQPLITAFDAYVAANGISNVYVTGHSMGGSMAIEYMSHHSGSQYQAITFAASPFGDTFFFVPFRKDYASDSRITQIEIAKDTTPMLFDQPNLLGNTNARAGRVIDFAGNQTLTIDTSVPANHIKETVFGIGVDYWGITANHSMDYYRQITDSVDADSWTRILARTGTQTVLLGGQQILGTSDFIVDGQRSGTNTSVGTGNDTLTSTSLDFNSKVIYGGKGNDTLTASANSTLLLGGVGDDRLIGGTGNDSLDGGVGTDTAVYSAWLNYTVTGTATSATVTALIGTGGIDTLSSIENLTFNNVTVTTAAAVNDAPVGISDNNASDAVIEAGTGVSGDSSAVGNVLNNDTDADSTLGLGETKAVKTVNNLTANVGNAVAGLYGSLVLLANGSYTYILDNTKAATNALTAGQVVTDTFIYTVVDAHGAISAPTTLSISITGSNDTPTLTNFTSAVASGNEDSEISITFANLQAQGNEADVDGLVTAFVIKAVNTGTLKIGTDSVTATAWSATNNTVDTSHQAYWTPALNANGILKAFTTVAKDNGGLESVSIIQVTLNVTLVNDAPVLAHALHDQATNQSIVFSYTIPTDSFADVDVGDTLSYQASQVDGSVLPAWLSFNPATRTFSGTPSSANVGALNIKLTATDSVGASVSDDFVLTVAGTVTPPVNHNPTGSASVVLTAGIEDTAYIVSSSVLLLGFSDVDGDNLTVSHLIANYGTVLSNANGTFTITPAADYNGAISLIYDVIDAKGGAVTATQNFNLTAVNDAPTLAGITAVTTINDTATATPFSTFIINDVDSPAQTQILKVMLDSALKGGLSNLDGGTYNVSTGVYSFTGSAATAQAVIRGLIFTPTAVGSSEITTFTVSVNDGSATVTDTSTTVVSTSINHAPVLTTPIAINYIDTQYVDNFATSTGLLKASDVDVNSVLTYGMTGGADNGNGSISMSNAYGTLTVISATGAYSFVANSAAIEALIANVTTTFTVTVSDGLLSASKILTVAIAQRGITETNGNDSLSGTTGTDSWAGLAGHDIYSVNNTGDTIIENVGAGWDVVYSTVSYALSANVEVLVLTGTAVINATGNAQNNYLVGNDAHNSLDGQGGSDNMLGGAGNDSYIVDNVGDVVTEDAGEGFDTVYSSISYALAANVEALYLTGTANLNGYGSHIQGDYLVGNSGDNSLDGQTGADGMRGGAGDDSYGVDNTGDVVIENVGEGFDTVYSSISYTLTANLEALVLTGTAAYGYGNALDNQLTGNNINNILVGGAGADTMIGRAGSDSYYVDNTNDTIVENANEGWDVVYSNASYTLSANVDVLVLTGTAAINATGNANNNYLVGNSGNNNLDGQGGIDNMLGGAGFDSYLVDNVGDVVTENAGEGFDTIFSSISCTIANNVEVVRLTGTANINAFGSSGQGDLLVGNSGDNGLEGFAGADGMQGGAGNDRYGVDNVGDVVTENLNAGFDTVFSSISYTLTTNVEALTLLGTANLNAFGNTLDNQLTGNSGDNSLVGGVGTDTMTGGAGNDTYFVDNIGDTTIESVGEGFDVVYSTVSYTMGASVEQLTLTGTATINATGTAANDYLFGNSGNNSLDGQGGADTLVGGLGQDTYNLTEPTAAIDTLRIATGDSIIATHDIANGFGLGIGNGNALGVDRLDLDSILIATNAAAVDGVDSGIVRSHSISNGIVSFDDINNYTTPLTITATNVDDVFGYLQTNITGQKTVAFISEGNTFVFQDGGATDTLVELVGVMASSVNDTGLAASSVWVI